MLVKIDEYAAVGMLLDRLEDWTDDYTTYKLYEQMYESYVFSGVFDGGDFDVNLIVDNDYVNWCDIISEGDEAYEDIKKLYNEFGVSDISCERGYNHGYNFIEAEYDGSFLVRN